jgi:hypothetical protein
LCKVNNKDRKKDDKESVNPKNRRTYRVTIRYLQPASPLEFKILVRSLKSGGSHLVQACNLQFEPNRLPSLFKNALMTIPTWLKSWHFGIPLDDSKNF